MADDRQIDSIGKNVEGMGLAPYSRSADDGAEGALSQKRAARIIATGNKGRSKPMDSRDSLLKGRG